MVALAVAFASVLTANAVANETSKERDLGTRLGYVALEVIDSGTGRLLPARIRLVPRGPFAEGRVRIAQHGRLEAALAPGVYRLFVTHGPEWSIFERELTVVAGSALRLRAALAREVDAAAFTACDLHVHTSASPDSDLEVAARADTLLAEDVQFAVITDHNHVTDAVAELAARGIAALPGVEVTTWAPEFGHFNAFPRAHAPPYQSTDARALLAALREEPEGFVQINHPRLEDHIGYFAHAHFDRASGRIDPAFPLAFDAIEVWNGYDLAASARRDEVFADWLALLARGHRLSATGSSDSHRAGRLPFAGYPRTYVRVPRAAAHAPGRVLAALKQGRSFVTNGPLIDVRVRDKGPGESVRLGRRERRLPVQVELAAPRWMLLREVEVWLGRTRVVRQTLAGADRDGALRVWLEVPVDDALSLVVAVRGSASMEALLGRADVAPYAFTNPIWIERDE